MRILWLCPFVPYPPDNGGNIRVFSLLSELTIHHEVTLVCFRSSLQGSEELSVLQTLCDQVYLLDLPAELPFKLHHLHDFFSHRPGSLAVYRKSLLKELREIASTNKFDLLHVEFMALAELALELPIVLKTVTEHYLAIEAHEFNLGNESGLRHWYFQRELKKMRSWEPEVLSKYSHVFVTNDQHRKMVVQWTGNERVSVVPNGVDLTYFKPQLLSRTNHSFFYMGSFHLDAANLRGLEHLLADVFPRIKERLPDAVLHVVGRGVPDSMVRQAESSVIIHGYVEDIRPLLASASAILMPIVGGSGTKLRVLVGMAMQQAVVSTEDGLAGLECRHNREVLVANSWTEMAEQAVEVATNDELRNRLTHAASLLVQRYSWSNIAQHQEDVWQQLMDQQ